MADAKFEKVTHSDKPFYGPRKLLVCGFDDKAQPEFKKLLQMAGIKEIPVVWVLSGQADTVLSDLFTRPDNSGSDLSSTLPRAIVVSGITENELHRLMNTCRKAGMKPVMWAALTPTSETWSLKSLLAELAAERKAMAQKK
jgi:hypothetical protein